MLNTLLRLVARLIARLNSSTRTISQEESAFFEQNCVKCESEFDVPPDFVFDRRRAYYCDECYSTAE